MAELHPHSKAASSPLSSAVASESKEADCFSLVGFESRLVFLSHLLSMFRLSRFAHVKQDVDLESEEDTEEWILGLTWLMRASKEEMLKLLRLTVSLSTQSSALQTEISIFLRFQFRSA